VSLVIRPGLQIEDSQLSWRFSRSSGPGGQSVNTSDSRVEISYDVAQLPPGPRGRALQRLHGRLNGTVLTVVSSEQRSQWQNRTAATHRLVELLRWATAPPPPPRRATRPTRASVERRLAGKRRRSDVKRLRRAEPD
jgi:ribosome-associated protein